MGYTKGFNNPYPNGWENLPSENTPITANALQAHTDAIESIEEFLVSGVPQKEIYGDSAISLGRAGTAGIRSEAIGIQAEASGMASVAHGNMTVASGQSSHAEGDRTQATNGEAHAEGFQTVASGSRSHAEGHGTKANGTDQHASGRFNEVDNDNKYALIIGNGTDDSNRHNALTVDWEGNTVAAGEVIDGQGNKLSEAGTATVIGTESPLKDSANGNIKALKLVGNSHKSKNLLNATLQTTTSNGITCTSNGDGTYTLNGTATANTSFYVGNIGKVANVKLVGRPSGNDGQTYYMAFLVGGSWSNTYRDTGNGSVLFSSDNDNNRVVIAVNSGTVCNNLLFKPMITTDTSATYNDYEPFGIIQPNGDVTSHNADNSKTSTVHTDRPLLSVNDIKNELIVNADGSGKFVQRVEAVTFNQISRYIGYSNDYFYISGLSKKVGNTNILASVYDVVDVTSTNELLNGQMKGHISNANVYFKDNRATTRDGILAFIGNEKIVYELATPIETDLTQTEVNALLSLQTFENETYVDADGCEFEIKYYLNNNIGNAISSVDKKASSSGGMDEYSTDEVAIGKWIDGHTIYRKVFYGEYKLSSSEASLGITVGNIRIINAQAISFKSTNFYATPICTNITNGVLRGKGMTSVSSTENIPMAIVIEYVKDEESAISLLSEEE